MARHAARLPRPCAAHALIAILLAATSFARAEDAPRRGHASSGEQRHVLLELFTSQGCSSCPPAADLVRELAARGFPREKVVPADFHVDYWDRLGWADPFASARWTERQKAVARALRQDSYYTPELVWDGRGHGSPADALAALRRALAQPAKARLDVTVELAARLTARGTAAPLQGSLDAGLAIEVLALEDDLATEVARGENGGRTLRETAVVRDAAVATTLERATREAVAFEASFDVPASWRREKLHVVALVREPKTALVWQALDVALVASGS